MSTDSPSPWISHTVLQAALIEWFDKNLETSPFFPGPLRVPHKVEADDILDVVYFGDFCDELVKFREWPLTRSGYRLWVLSSAVKKVLISLFGFKETEIGIIPRYDLFPSSKVQTKFPEKSETFTLVYSGRFVSNKNFDLFLRVASSLQLRPGFENMKVLCTGHYPVSEKDLIASFSYLIMKLPWKNEPIFETSYGPQDWMKQSIVSPILMNLSKHRREDFGVSVSQARSEGWPVILSDWGGHRDIGGSGVLKVPCNLIPRNTSIIDKVDVESISSYIQNKWNDNFIDYQADFSVPLPVTQNRLEDLRTPFWDEIENTGLEVLRSRYLHEEFFEKYHVLFGEWE